MMDRPLHGCFHKRRPVHCDICGYLLPAWSSGITRVFIVFLALATRIVAQEITLTEPTVNELVSFATNTSNPEKQTWALDKLKDRFSQEPEEIDLFLRIVGDTNAAFVDQKYAIKGLKQGGSRETRVVASMQNVLQESMGKIGGKSDEEYLALEAIETLVGIGPPAYPATSVLLALSSNPNTWFPLRLAAIRTLAAIGPAAANASNGLETIFLNVKEHSLHLAAIEALASIGSSSTRIFKTLCTQIVSKPNAPPEELKVLANAFVTIGAAITSNMLSTIEPCRIQELRETANQTSQFIRAHAAVLQGISFSQVDVIVAQFEAEQKRRPCNFLVYVAYKFCPDYPKLLLGNVGLIMIGISVVCARFLNNRVWVWILGKWKQANRVIGLLIEWIKRHFNDEIMKNIVSPSRTNLPTDSLAADKSSVNESDIYRLFRELNPPDQLDHVMVRLGMPLQFRPRPVLRLDQQINHILDWALKGGSLDKLQYVLQDIIKEQNSSLPQEKPEMKEGGVIPGNAIPPSESTVSPLDLDSGQERRRRIDAAAPARAALGETIELWVQVCTPDAPELGKDNWPSPNKPIMVAGVSRKAVVNFPVDAQTGHIRSAILHVRIVAPDFAVKGSQKVIMEVPLVGNSEPLRFLLKTKQRGDCCVNLEISADGGGYVGTIPISTHVNGGASPMEMNKVSLLLVVVVSSDALPIRPKGGSPTPKETEVLTPVIPENHYSDARKEILSKALIRLGFLAANQELPDPYHTATGVQGKSQVQFLFLPRDGSGISLVAKFDEPERAEKEWKAIEKLRRLNTPPEAMLPIWGNQSIDGVIIYRDITGLTLNGNVIDFKDLLLRQLKTNPVNCETALKQTFDGLAHFYAGQPGAAYLDKDGLTMRWHDVFPQISHRLEEIEKTVIDDWRDINWNIQRLAFPNSDSSNSPPNPFYRKSRKEKSNIEIRLNNLIGKVMRSRVHGDLNLTNILINLDSQHCPNNIFIIDLANSEENKVTATDFARMESEFWHETFVGLLGKDSEENKTDQMLQSFVAIRDCLDGRLKRLHDSASDLERHCVRFVCLLRQHALSTLRSNDQKYLLNDYFESLFFRHIAALTFPSVTQDKRKVRMAVLGAALTLQVIEDIESGSYAPDSVKLLRSPIRPCEDMLPTEPYK
jgi:hypothetical protein